MKEFIIEVVIDRLNERGYGVGKIQDREVWILNSLPGEKVIAKIFKRKKGILYGAAEEIKEKSLQRIEAKEDHFLACSPWQILNINDEIRTKKDLITKFYKDYANTELIDFELVFKGKEYNYRNKFEFSFYGHSDNSITFAYHKREGSKAKYAFDECVMAPEKVNKINKKLINFLNDKGIKSNQLKGLMNRYSFSEKKVVSAIFVKDENLVFTISELKALLDDDLKGLLILYSTHKSPAFVETKRLYELGQTDIEESILGIKFIYPFDGFFQVNPHVFELAAKDIINFVNNNKFKESFVIDLYSGVGTIGLLISSFVKHVTGIEIFEKSLEYGEKNKSLNKISNIDFIQEKAEGNSLNIIETADILIVDPPRTGLHPKVIKQIRETPPTTIIYLSCNPKTQAQNFNELKDFYEIQFVKGYNFYPHTPHVEFLIILSKK